jgi:transposase
VVLALADEPESCVSVVADALAGGDRKFVRKWRDRYLKEGLEALKGQRRPGRPSRIGAVSRCQLIAMACGKPSDFRVPHRTRWTVDSLMEAYSKLQMETPSLDSMSRTSVLRILNKAEIRPHRVKMWLHSPDPLFREKVTEICALYLKPPLGTHVLCVDEKTGMQALGRKHPGRQLAPGQDARMDYEYVRNGTRKLLACWDIRTGEVYGEVRENRKAVDLVEFMDALAERYPTGDVHIIWDNLNIHYDGPSSRWTKFNHRHGQRFHFHYTPIHASWVNQIELWFGILQKRVLRYGVFNSLEQLDEAVLGYIGQWNVNERKPFKWSFKGYPLQSGLKDAA